MRAWGWKCGSVEGKGGQRVDVGEGHTPGCAAHAAVSCPAAAAPGCQAQMPHPAGSNGSPAPLRSLGRCARDVCLSAVRPLLVELVLCEESNLEGATQEETGGSRQQRR